MHLSFGSQPLLDKAIANVRGWSVGGLTSPEATKCLWLRRSKNTLADKLSRFTDMDDWGITEALLQRLQEDWGILEVDRFANEQNAKLRRFNSRFACPGVEAVDAFSQDWAGVRNLLVPPPRLIAQVIQHLCKAKGVLVAPFWRSSSFWPFLFSWQGPTKVVRAWVELRHGAKYLRAGNQPGSIFTPSMFKGSLIAVLLDASA